MDTQQEIYRLAKQLHDQAFPRCSYTHCPQGSYRVQAKRLLETRKAVLSQPSRSGDGCDSLVLTPLERHARAIASARG